MKVKQLSPQAFNIAAKTATDRGLLGDKALSIARAVLVDGHTQAQAANLYDVTRQRASYAVSQFREIYEELQPVVAGAYVSMNLDLPDQLAHELTIFLEEYRNAPGQKQAQALKILMTAVRKGRQELKAE